MYMSLLVLPFLIPDFSIVWQVLWKQLSIPSAPWNSWVLHPWGPWKEALYGYPEAPATRISNLRGANKWRDLWGIQERPQGVC